MILTCCLYLPPNLSSERLERFIDRFTDSVSLAQVYLPTTIIITGDFNTGNIFLPNQAQNHSGVTPFDIKLYDAIYSLSLTQVISTPTRLTESTANLRDLIITSNPVIVTEQGVLSSFSNLDHFPVYISINIKTPKTKTKTKKIWDYNKLDTDKLIRHLTSVNWEDIVDQDIHEATKEFTSTILAAATEAIPQKPYTLSQPTNHG